MPAGGGGGGGRSNGGQDTPTKEQKEAKGDGEEESSASDEESSSYDEEEAEKRRSQCLDDMAFLEQQFVDLKDILYKERVQDVDQKIRQLSDDAAPEYMCPVKELEEAKNHKVRLADFLHNCQMASINHKYDQEMLSVHKDFVESCEVARDRLRSEIDDKLRRLKEERILSQIDKESSSKKRKSNKVSEFLLPDKRKKPVTVTGPCVVYMLKEIDILEDLHEIKKGIAATEVRWRHHPSS